MKYNVTITDEHGEILAMSEEPVEGKHLAAEGRDLGREAWLIGVQREKRPDDYPEYCARVRDANKEV